MSKQTKTLFNQKVIDGDKHLTKYIELVTEEEYFKNLLEDEIRIDPKKLFQCLLCKDGFKQFMNLLIHIDSQNHQNLFKNLKSKAKTSKEVENAIEYLESLKFRKKLEKNWIQVIQNINKFAGKIQQPIKYC